MAKSDLFLLIVFAIISILSFIVGDTAAGLGWTVATMIQLRIVAKNMIDEDEQKKI